MSFRDYAELPAVNWSTLKAMAKSPLHYQHELLSPRADTPAMRFGRACHTAVLEPDRFPLEWVLYEGRRAGNAWTEFAAEFASKGILTVDEYETALRVRDAVHAHPAAAALLAACTFEQTVEWSDPGTGIACKARPDAFKPGTVVDLKTTRTIDARRFARVAYELDYFGQLAFYAEGLAISSGAGAFEPFIIAVESDEPHDVAVFGIEPESLEAATDMAHDLLERLAECRATGEWPGRYAEAMTLELPPWALDDGTDEILILEGRAPRPEVARP